MQSDSHVFALDSSALHRGASWLVRVRNGLAEAQRRGRLVRAYVPSVVAAEMGARLRRQHVGASLTLLEDMLEPIELAEFTKADADAAGAVLARWFPTDRDWQKAKVAAWLQRRATPTVMATLPERVPGTTDWWIAADVEARGWTLVTHDRGREFQYVTKRIGPDEFVKWLERVALP